MVFIPFFRNNFRLTNQIKTPDIETNSAKPITVQKHDQEIKITSPAPAN
jgi:hypothetical protein